MGQNLSLFFRYLTTSTIRWKPTNTEEDACLEDALSAKYVPLIQNLGNLRKGSVRFEKSHYISQQSPVLAQKSPLGGERLLLASSDNVTEKLVRYNLRAVLDVAQGSTLRALIWFSCNGQKPQLKRENLIQTEDAGGGEASGGFSGATSGTTSGRREYQNLVRPDEMTLMGSWDFSEGFAQNLECALLENDSSGWKIVPVKDGPSIRLPLDFSDPQVLERDFNLVVQLQVVEKRGMSDGSGSSDCGETESGDDNIVGGGTFGPDSQATLCGPIGTKQGNKQSKKGTANGKTNERQDTHDSKETSSSISAGGTMICSGLSHFTYIKVKGNLESHFRPYISKQKLFYCDRVYEIRDIFGIEDENYNYSSMHSGLGLSRECVVCMSDLRTVSILPCRHLCLCVHCANYMRSSIARERSMDPFEGNNRHNQIARCPICRQKIGSFFEIREAGAKIRAEAVTDGEIIDI